MGNLQTRISLSVKWSWSLPVQTSCSSRGRGPFRIMRNDRSPPETSWIPRNEGVQGQERRWSDSMQVAVPSEAGVFLPHSLWMDGDPPPSPHFPPSLGLARPPPSPSSGQLHLLPTYLVTQSSHLARESAPIKETNGLFPVAGGGLK